MRINYMTEHAEIRKQQRCVPPLVIDWLIVYGRREQSFGLVKVWFDRCARKELASDVGHLAVSHLSKYLTAALVLDPITEKVITVEWLH
jgi:hypothetical protein